MHRLSVISMVAALALSLAWPAAPARAADDGSDSNLNATVTIGILCVVVGILVYVGWQSDREERESRGGGASILPLMEDEGRQLGLYLDDVPGGEAFDLAGGFAFRTEF